jgi:hypothetical protein
MSEELKPCPFNHSNNNTSNLTFYEKIGATRNWQIRCVICGAMGPLGKTKEEAIAEWNKRVDSKRP